MFDLSPISSAEALAPERSLSHASSAGSTTKDPRLHSLGSEDEPMDVILIAFLVAGAIVLAWLSAAAWVGLSRLRRIQESLTSIAGGLDRGTSATEVLGETVENARRELQSAVLGALEESLHGAAPVDTGRLGAAVGELVETQRKGTDSVVHALRGVREEVENLKAQGSDPSGTAPHSADPLDRPPAQGDVPVHELARRKLEALGFEHITVVEGHRAGGDCTVVVEARRGGTIHKGKLFVEGSHVVDVQLRPAHQIFP